MVCKTRHSCGCFVGMGAAINAGTIGNKFARVFSPDILMEWILDFIYGYTLQLGLRCAYILYGRLLRKEILTKLIELFRN